MSSVTYAAARPDHVKAWLGCLASSVVIVPESACIRAASVTVFRTEMCGRKLFSVKVVPYYCSGTVYSSVIRLAASMSRLRYPSKSDGAIGFPWIGATYDTA